MLRYAKVKFMIFCINLWLPEQIARSQGTKLHRSQRQKIVDLHNFLRNKVASGNVKSQAKAQNMREMSWDEELAAQAQKWADNCKFQHDPNLTNRRGRAVGQNLAIFRSTSPQSPDFERMIEGWFNEVYKYGYKNDGTFQHSSGHYSQMIWADTSRVGGGYSTFKEGPWYSVLLVCNYYPALSHSISSNQPDQPDPKGICAQGCLFRALLQHRFPPSAVLGIIFYINTKPTGPVLEKED